MICPYCSANKDKVIDSRPSEGGKVIRRRRHCLSCGKRFTSYERVEQATRLVVVKRDGRRVPFTREKISSGVHAACGKRKIPEEDLQRLIDEVEEELHKKYDREVESLRIGELVMSRLKSIDEVAFIRFASEYYQFKGVDDIIITLQDEVAGPKDVKDQGSLFGEGAS